MNELMKSKQPIPELPNVLLYQISTLCINNSVSLPPDLVGDGRGGGSKLPHDHPVVQRTTQFNYFCWSQTYLSLSFTHSDNFDSHGCNNFSILAYNSTL